MVTTKLKSAAGAPKTVATPKDPLQDPLTTPPVDGAAKPIDICPDDIVQATSALESYAALPPGEALQFFASNIRLQLPALHIEWTVIQFDHQAGLIDEATALSLYGDLCARLHALLLPIPMGTHPDIDALKTDVADGMVDYIVRGQKIEQAEAEKRVAARKMAAAVRAAAGIAEPEKPKSLAEKKHAEDVQSVMTIHDSMINAEAAPAAASGRSKKGGGRL